MMRWFLLLALLILSPTAGFAATTPTATAGVLCINSVSGSVIKCAPKNGQSPWAVCGCVDEAECKNKQILVQDNATCTGIKGSAGNAVVQEVETSAPTFNLPNIEPTQFIARLIQLMFGLTGSLALVSFVVAGLLYIGSAGDSTKITQAKGIMVMSTLGLVVIFAGYLLTSFLLSTAGSAVDIKTETGQTQTP